MIEFYAITLHVLLCLADDHAAVPLITDPRLVEWVSELGGTVTRDTALPGHPASGVNLAGCPATDADMRLLASIPTLRDVNISGTMVTASGIGSLLRRGHVRVLRAESLGLDDEDLSCLRLAPQLESLGICDNPDVTGVGLNGLVFPRLNFLDLRMCEITEAGLAALPTVCPNLRELCVDELPEGACDAIGRVVTLERLHISGWDVGDGHLARLSHLPRLRYLNVVGSSVSDAGLRSLGRVRESLVELLATDTCVTGTALSVFPRLASVSLGGVTLRGPFIRPDRTTFTQLCTLQNIREVSFWYPQIEESDAEVLGTLCNRLESVGVMLIRDDERVTCQIVAALCRAKKVILRCDPVDLEGLDPNLPVRELEIHSSKLAVSDIAAVASLRQLESLRIRGMNWTTGQVRELAKLTHLRSVRLNRDDMPAESWRELEMSLGERLRSSR